MEFKTKYDKDDYYLYNVQENHFEIDPMLKYDFVLNAQQLDVLKNIKNPSKILLFLSLVRYICNNDSELQPNDLVQVFETESVLFYITKMVNIRNQYSYINPYSKLIPKATNVSIIFK